MVTARRLAIMALTLLGTLTIPAPAPLPGAQDNSGRLRVMPPELRTHLSDQLKSFALLDRSEQDAVRTLDRKIAEEPEESRVIDFAVLRRYHSWLQGLNEVRRNELSALPPSRRFALVSKFLADHQRTDPPESLSYRNAEPDGASPFDIATRIEAWMKLNVAQRAEVASLPDADRLKKMGQYAREFKISVPRPPLSETEALYNEAVAGGRYPYLKKAEEARKQPQLKHKFVDNYYFIKHPPSKVNPDKLLQFDRALPAWIGGNLDTRSPDDARRRLSILYRLVYPHGEMPDVLKAPPAPTPSRPVRPAATPPLPSKPF